MSSVRDRFRVSALLLLLSVLPAASAHAVPFTLYADPAPNAGFDPDDVAKARAAGAGAPTPVAGISDGGGYFRITAPNGIRGVKGKNKKKPSRGASRWTLHVARETPADRLRNFSVVILGHSPRDPFKYKTRNVGLEIGSELPWQLVTPWSGGPTYLAYQLGNLSAGQSYEIPIEYRVGQKLKKKNGVYFFPLYSVEYLSVPEPSTLALGLAGIAFVLGARRER